MDRRYGDVTLLRVLTVVFLLICVLIAVVILLQEGKQAGLGGAISGTASDSYWGKNKSRSAEGMLENITKIAIVLYFVIAIILNTGLVKY
ncbi:MAG: preprotein translocase subunit SecG [Lachnospiraceae bacterium]|nr:preprotein translocase subunit SecG [Lachnospiraceae bacterium]